LKLNSASQELGYPEVSGFVIRLKVFIQKLPWHPFHFFFLIDPGAYDIPEQAAIVQVRRANSQVLETEVPHVFGKKHGQRIWLLSHGASGIPDLHAAAAGCVWDHVFDNTFQRLQVSEKIGERHVTAPDF
jgi:hypothetical protein